jgi:hypothetical protein
MKLIDVGIVFCLATYILDKNVQVVVRNDLDVNEHERLSNITLRHN